MRWWACATARRICSTDIVAGAFSSAKAATCGIRFTTVATHNATAKGCNVRETEATSNCAMLQPQVWAVRAALSRPEQ